jgi:formate/nitrite transporter FocA (FNT family)
LIPVTLGNIIGGSVMVALVYYTIYRRGLKS